MSVREQLHGVVAALQPVIHGVPDGAMSDPTPCEDLDVRGLVRHLLGTSEAMRRIGAGEPLDPQDPWGTDGAEPGPQWRGDLSDRLIALADAWLPESAWEGDALDGALPRATVGRMAYAEVVLHGWDLAVATGQGVELHPDHVAAAEEVMEEIGEPGRSTGAFGPPPSLAEDATTFDRALAASGRDPDWTP